VGSTKPTDKVDGLIGRTHRVARGRGRAPSWRRRIGVLAGVAALVTTSVAVSLTVMAAGAWADTQTTCGTDPTGCKTVTVDANGALTSGSTSGTITLGGTSSGGALAASTTYNLVDVIEALATNHEFVGGSYTLSFASPCTTGSATGGTYTVVGGSSTYPMTPPATSGTLPTITTDSSGNFSCAYTLTYPTVDSSNDTMCDGHLCAVRNDVFVVSQANGATVTAIASASVLPGGSPPTSVPEAPYTVLLLLAAVAGAGFVILRRYRRGGWGRQRAAAG
jgi:hypothetical protein